ncbi:hypothetical protein GCM10010464_74220 [Pseudonocardia yunnanensis]
MDDGEAGAGAAGFCGVRVAGLIDGECRTVARQFRTGRACDTAGRGERGTGPAISPLLMLDVPYVRFVPIRSHRDHPASRQPDVEQ